MTIRHTTRCPACGHTWERRKAKGRPRSKFYRAEGRTQHADDWAAELGVHQETIRRALHKFGGDFELVVRKLRKPTEREYMADAAHPIVTAGGRGWRPKAKYPHERKDME